MGCSFRLATLYSFSLSLAAVGGFELNKATFAKSCETDMRRLDIDESCQVLLFYNIIV